MSIVLLDASQELFSSCDTLPAEVTKNKQTKQSQLAVNET